MKTVTSLIYDFRSRPSKLFLIDGIGAFITSFTLGIVFTNIQELIGMPKKILIPLALAAFVFFLYSISCFLFVKHNWRPFLKVIAITNFLYCLATAVLITLLFDQLTAAGRIYFIGEIAIIGVLIFIEISVSK
jgi:hypothetical protein